ncbi:HAD family hydrolase [Hespellia stercorisuis]|uniref:Phosphoglycolate phosphatase n=1 Tax=Hespellia stercorisuis DSM 15480 TaxID=1121950 RepID=A0A1M6TRL3_9FIRM|nr:HAD family hydrolase [Hespellia stercorisuis]SHK59564.1 phosphoglycolate phosphatase [Hespellia stercorisuis DSM 15480]
MKKLDGIIFDIDGTIWDSTDVVADSWNVAIETCTDSDVRVTAPQLKQLFGKTMDEICDVIFPTLTRAEKNFFAEKCYEVENERLLTYPGTVYEGMYETIEALSQQYPLFVVSNCQKDYIPITLEATKMTPFFKDHLCFGETNTSKGKTIRTLMERNHLEHVIYVGDTQGDADACKEAGVPFVWARYGFGEVPDAKESIGCIAELLALVAE